MQIDERNLGVATADGEDVRLRYEHGDLVLSFRDWKEQQQEVPFQGVLTFRWEGEFDEKGIREDMTYEVIGSTWLARQAELHAMPASEYAHYKLCFNACGVLDVLCRKVEPRLPSSR